MKLHQLRALVAIDETGSLQEASRNLHVTQPALSRAIKELEMDLGVTILVRSNRGVTLTDFGKRLIGHARHVLQSVRRARQDIENMRGMQLGEITIGVTPVVALMAPLTQVLNEFRENNPQVMLRILEMRPAQLLNQLREGALDFAVISQLPQTGGSLDWTPICRLPSVIAVRKTHPLRHANSLRALLQAEWLSLDPLNDPNSYFNQLFSNCNLPVPARVIECTSMSLAQRLVFDSDLAIILNEQSFADEQINQHLQIVRVAETVPDSFVSLACIEHTLLTRIASQLFERLQERFDEVYSRFGEHR